MAIKPGIGKRLSRDEQRESLWNAWASLTTAADDFTRRQAERLFDILRQSVAARIVRDAAQYAPLGDSDERAYVECVRLMDIYREVLSIYEQHLFGVTAFPVKSILDGLHSLIASRLKQYEDTAENGGGNPVTLEKQAIYDKAAAYAGRHIDSQARLFAQHRLAGEIPLFRRALLGDETVHIEMLLTAQEHLQESVQNFFFRGIYAFYGDSLRFCLAHINDMHQRKTARYYFDLVDSEQEVLSSIIKIQAGALEFAVEHNPVSAWEKTAIFQLLALLREGHQSFSRAAAEIRECYKNACDLKTSPAAATVQNFEEFTGSLTEYLTEQKNETARQARALPAVMDEQRTTFLSALDKETDALFERIGMGLYRAAYRFQRIVSEELIMADEMSDAFERMCRDWPNMDVLPPEAKMEIEILRGIAETIDIKIESIRESVYTFNEASIRLINEYASGKQEITYDERTAAYNLVLDQWMSSMLSEETGETASNGATGSAITAAFFERCMGLELFATYAQYYEKRENEYTAKIDKLMHNFKKETLLYEVSTYEEVIIYSVPRLREAEWEPVRHAVSLLDDTLKTLEMLLKKNNIFVIRPEPHDLFNGREHEVLMAEKQEGFNKGEIIKPINSGYKLKDVVILRANVIAAR